MNLHESRWTRRADSSSDGYWRELSLREADFEIDGTPVKVNIRLHYQPPGREQEGGGISLTLEETRELRDALTTIIGDVDVEDRLDSEFLLLRAELRRQANTQSKETTHGSKSSEEGGGQESRGEESTSGQETPAR